MEESHSISFENTPFSVEDEKIFDCQHGHHYYTKKERKGKTAQLRLQGTNKLAV